MFFVKMWPLEAILQLRIPEMVHLKNIRNCGFSNFLRSLRIQLGKLWPCWSYSARRRGIERLHRISQTWILTSSNPEPRRERRHTEAGKINHGSVVKSCRCCSFMLHVKWGICCENREVIKCSDAGNFKDILGSPGYLFFLHQLPMIQRGCFLLVYFV